MPNKYVVVIRVHGELPWHLHCESQQEARRLRLKILKYGVDFKPCDGWPWSTPIPPEKIVSVRTFKQENKEGE